MKSMHYGRDPAVELSNVKISLIRSGLPDAQFSGNTSVENSSGTDGKTLRHGNAGDDRREGVQHGEDDDEEFTYEDSSIHHRRPSEEEDFRYPVSPLVETQPPFELSHSIESQPQPVQPSPAQLEAIFAAASAGDLPLLQKLFETALSQGDTQAFSLANDATSRTGLTALHAAANRGHTATVRWRE